ncbi:MAG: glycosyltransferase family 1 protein [Muribaculaceae bacterium]|nr:glycosyltransferase family 1 protein [Muribaculaceae bacterium]
MKILFVGDASNLHNCLAGALRQMGYEAVTASGGSLWMNTGRDINLARHPGTLGTIRYIADIIRALPRMRGFDVVHIASPIFLSLKPDRLRHIFSYLKRHNGKIVLSALGTDYVYYRACHDGHTFRYSDYMVGDRPSPYVDSAEFIAQHQENWEQPFMKDYSDFILSQIDGAVACLYEYYAAYKPVLGDKVVYAGIPIDTESLRPIDLNQEPEKVRFFIGIQRDRNVVKGVDRLLAALKDVHAECPELCEICDVENLPYSQYLNAMRSSHVLIDQLYSYTPATNALLAMAQGLVAVSGAEPEYYRLIGENDNHPIINVSPLIPGDIHSRLRHIIAHKDELPALSRASRDFVVKHNDAHLVARRHLNFWNTI